MPSIAEQIAQHVEALLIDQTPAGSLVMRDRGTVMTRDDQIALLVELADEETVPLGGGQMSGPGAVEADVLTLLVVACVRADDWQFVADTVRVAAHRRLTADETLRGYRIRRSGCQWRPASADIPFGYCSQQYRFTYASRHQDITLAG